MKSPNCFGKFLARHLLGFFSRCTGPLTAVLFTFLSLTMVSGSWFVQGLFDGAAVAGSGPNRAAESKELWTRVNDPAVSFDDRSEAARSLITNPDPQLLQAIFATIARPIQLPRTNASEVEAVSTYHAYLGYLPADPSLEAYSKSPVHVQIAHMRAKVFVATTKSAARSPEGSSLCQAILEQVAEGSIRTGDADDADFTSSAEREWLATAFLDAMRHSVVPEELFQNLTGLIADRSQAAGVRTSRPLSNPPQIALS